MGNKVVLGAVVLLIGGFLGWYVYSNGTFGGVKSDDKVVKMQVPAGSSSVKETVVESTESREATKGGVDQALVGTSVSYKDTGFSPKVLSVKKGTAVTFTNNSTKGMWVASAPHPSHTILPEFDEFKSVSKGEQYTFTFEKVGTWKYHNHVNPSDVGSVVVTE